MLQSALLAHDTPVTEEKTEGTSQMVALRTALLFSTGMMLDVEYFEVAGSGKQAAKAMMSLTAFTILKATVPGVSKFSSTLPQLPVQFPDFSRLL